MATESRQLYKVEAISGPSGTRICFLRVGRTYYPNAQSISKFSRRRVENILRGINPSDSTDLDTMPVDLEIFVGTNGMSIGRWVHQEPFKMEVNDGDHDQAMAAG